MMTQNMEVMLVNHNRAFVSRVEFRRAIAHALNRTKLITNAYMNRARAADVPVPPIHGCITATPFNMTLT